MYYYFNGNLAGLRRDRAVIDCAGVGYLAYISAKTYESIVSSGAFDAEGNLIPLKVKLFIHQVVRDDAIELFGFFSDEECEVFKSLISVSGLGPKGALAILSTLSVSKLAAAVASGDAKAISASPGVGVKTAQKIIIELKDKFAKRAEFSDGATLDSEIASVSAGAEADDAIDALVVLGYNKGEASRAVAKCKSATLEGKIREALALLSK